MFDHANITEKTRMFLNMPSNQSQQSQVANGLNNNPRLTALREKNELMTTVIQELNEANRADLRRHLYLTQGQIASNIFTNQSNGFAQPMIADKENYNSANVSGSNRNSSNKKRILENDSDCLKEQFSHPQPFLKRSRSQDESGDSNFLRQAVYRPGQDLEDLIEQNNTLEKFCSYQQQFLKDLFEESEVMVKENIRIKQSIIDTKSHIAMIDKQTENFEKEFCMQVRKLQEEIGLLCDEKERLSSQMEIEEEMNSALEEENRIDEKEYEELMALQEQLKAEIEETKASIQAMVEDSTQIQNEKEESEMSVEQLKADAQAAIIEKRKLNDELQQLKGNIRVYCRVRPLLKSEVTEEKATNVLNVSTNQSLTLTLPNNMIRSENIQREHKFNFEQIFDEECSQATIFAEMSQLIQSLIDGFNICIFAYGQTGSGKTFTIEGGSTPEEKGLMQRSMEMIFEQVQELREFGWEYQLQVSFQEVYMEQHRDLISNFRVNDKQDQLIFAEINSIEEFYPLMRRARENRKTGSTMCNDQSSRSHSIFQLRLNGTNARENKSCNGTLNLVDLAGSERVMQSKVEGQLLEETKFINRSLTALSDVINALAQKDKHVPFRNSKLTYLLSPFLGEGSKTLMFLNLSPSSTNYQQTLCSLRFGDKVSSVKLKKNK